MNINQNIIDEGGVNYQIKTEQGENVSKNEYFVKFQLVTLTEVSNYSKWEQNVT